MTNDFIEKCIEGDRDALNRLIENYKDYCFSIAFGLTRDENLSKDIVQDSMISVINSISKFKNESKFSTWLFTIVYRQSLKTMSYENRFQKDFSNVSVMKDYNLGEGNLELLERDRLINSSLDRIPPKEKIVINLFYLNEKSIKEIASIMGEDMGYIKVLLHRGRKSLRNILKHRENHGE